MTESRRLDAAALAGLAHPLRLALVEALMVHGPATATELGRRLGESSGATSYHLRQLERHGFVEEDPDRGTRRQRYWRPVHESTTLRADDFADDPAMTEAARLVVRDNLDRRQARHRRWVETREAWPAPWRAAGNTSTSHFRLTAEDAAELAAELQAVVMRWAEREQEAPGARAVEVHVDLFPGGEPPAEQDEQDQQDDQDGHRS